MENWELIYISFIISKRPNKGNLSKLFNYTLKAGIKFPQSIGKMNIIVRKKGFKQTYEWNDVFNENVDVWVKDGLKEVK